MDRVGMNRVDVRVMILRKFVSFLRSCGHVFRAFVKDHQRGKKLFLALGLGDRRLEIEGPTIEVSLTGGLCVGPRRNFGQRRCLAPLTTTTSRSCLAP